MTNKIYAPGEIVENSGLYPVVDQNGNDQGYEVTVVQGEPFPPTPEKGWGFGTPRLAKTTSDNDTSLVLSISESLPDRRPVFRGNPALVPSDSLPNGRPILMQSKHIANCDHLPLHRPIFQNEEMSITRMHGNRPVFRLHSNFTPSDSLPEHRPIFSQEAGGDKNLMGYID